ncbi:ferritin family protein [Clostridium akagii]|uniref:ferritin family protein n=1 Tax=Clostridium akagii TaxID=91623 RepID=UPI00047E8D60|nr:ferritin family protein [Clostridium akagii]
MSIFGITKGTELEEQVDKNCIGEEKGASLYTALALLAKEGGQDEVSEALLNIAMDEARHAGLYAVLNGHSNQDIFNTLSKMSPLETAAGDRLSEFAKLAGNLGLDEAADKIQAVALDEVRHGEVLKSLVEKFSR